VCHVIDNTNLYIELLRKIIAGDSPSYGRSGFYLAASGSIAWDDLYSAMAAGLAKRNVIKDTSIERADADTLEKMGAAIGVPSLLVPVQVGGK
jgi:hypothetical protein